MADRMVEHLIQTMAIIFKSSQQTATSLICKKRIINVRKIHFSKTKTSLLSVSFLNALSARYCVIPMVRLHSFLSDHWKLEFTQNQNL